jgi:hypothetical protein
VFFPQSTYNECIMEMLCPFICVYNLYNCGMDLYAKCISFATKDFYLQYINIKTMIYAKWTRNFMENVCSPLEKIFPSENKSNVSANRRMQWNWIFLWVINPNVIPIISYLPVITITTDCIFHVVGDCKTHSWTNTRVQQCSIVC